MPQKISISGEFLRTNDFTDLHHDFFHLNTYTYARPLSGNHLQIKDPMHTLLLEVLYTCSFYKRLHLYLFLVDQENLDRLVTLSGLEMLSGDIHRIDSSLVDLRRLSICFGDELTNIENLPNLDHIYFTNVTTTHLLPVIYCSPNLRIIKIRS